MKNRLYIFVIVAALVTLAGGSASAQDKVNLSLRQAIYFTGSKTDTFDESQTYVGAGKTLEIKTSQGTKCEVKGKTITDCYFNLGVITWRELKGKIVDQGTLSTYGLFKSYDGSLIGNTIYFADGVGIKKVVFPVKMQVGQNQVTFTVDPENKTAESNENDNSVTVNFNIVDDSIKRPPIRQPKKIDLTTTEKIYLVKDPGEKQILQDQAINNQSSANLSQSKSAHCYNPLPDGSRKCLFDLGFVAVKNNRVNERAQTEYFVYDNGNKVYGAGLDMVEGVSEQEVVFGVKLEPGEHYITVTINPEKKIDEESETNNTVGVFFTVNKN